MKALRLIPVIVLASMGVVTTTGAAGATNAPQAAKPFACASGNVPPGTYSSVTISGTCYMPAGNIDIKGDLTVESGALLDATTPGDPAATPLLPATVWVNGNVSVHSGGVLFLGCSPFISCSNAVSYDHVDGSLTADGALGVVVHSTSIGGNLTVKNGGGGTDTCTNIPALWLSDPALANGEGPGVPVPPYTDFEDVGIGGNASVTGLQSCWLGSLRDQILGNATFSNNSMGDPDALEIDNNLISGNMSCSSNVPAVQFGDSDATPNVVWGSASGECGFSVLAPNPAPEAHEGQGVPEHLTVKASELGSYAGTRTPSGSKTKVLGTTESGDTIAGEEQNVVFAGTGLTGRGTEGVLVTIRPGGEQLFYAHDLCQCTFGGRNGKVAILAIGTTSGKTTSGTFQIVETGGGLVTLAGYGTFSSVGESAGTLQLSEQLVNS
jgi:hypothetical protein